MAGTSFTTLADRDERANVVKTMKNLVERLERQTAWEERARTPRKTQAVSRRRKRGPGGPLAVEFRGLSPR